jgi:uncharacterized membrane protein YhhN
MIPWIIINLVLFGSLFLGHSQGVPGFMNVFWFIVWTLITLVFIAWFRTDRRYSPTIIPLWLSLSLNSLILLFIVWDHNIITGAFWLTHMIMIGCMRGDLGDGNK